MLIRPQGDYDLLSQTRFISKSYKLFFKTHAATVLPSAKREWATAVFTYNVVESREKKDCGQNIEKPVLPPDSGLSPNTNPPRCYDSDELRIIVPVTELSEILKSQSVKLEPLGIRDQVYELSSAAVRRMSVALEALKWI